MNTQNVNVKTATQESSRKIRGTMMNEQNARSSATDTDDMVFFRAKALLVFSMAVNFDGDSEPVALCNFQTLAELKREYPDMVLISEADARSIIAERKLAQELAENAVIESASLRGQQNTGRKFVCIDAGRS